MQKRELFELLSKAQTQNQEKKRVSISQTAAPTVTGRVKTVDSDTMPAAVGGASAEEAAPGTVTRIIREGVTFPVPTAISFLAVGAVLLVTAFMLGHRAGVLDAAIAARGDTPEAGVLVADGMVRETRPSMVTPPSNMFVVRISDYALSERNRFKAEEDMAYAAAHARVREAHLPVFVFENDAVYSVGVGVFASANEATVAELLKLFRGLDGPPTSVRGAPYERATCIQVEKIGKVVARHES